MDLVCHLINEMCKYMIYNKEGMGVEAPHPAQNKLKDNCFIY